MKAIGVALALACASFASATPQFWETFLKTYSVKAGSEVAKAECSTCHTQIPNHNAYGKTVNSALKSAKTEVLTTALLGQVEDVDPDGDGWRNGDEIRRGTLPGDPKSKPDGEPPVTKMDGEHRSSSGGEMPGLGEHDHAATPGALVPKHSFHPLLVHFPIALFLFGTLLDLCGIRLNRGHVRAAALWNMCAASVSTAVAIPTGFIAASRMGYPLSYGTAVFGHLAAGISAAVLMLAVVLWRVRGIRNGREPGSWRYVLTLVAASGLVSLAGHWGGGLVYGT